MFTTLPHILDFEKPPLAFLPILAEKEEVSKEGGQKEETKQMSPFLHIYWHRMKTAN